MRERKVLNDNEWYGWVEWMRTCFRLGTIKVYWSEYKRVNGMTPFLKIS